MSININRTFEQGFAYTERLWNFFERKPCYGIIFEVFCLPIFIILSDIDKSTIKLSNFQLYRVQRRLNWFVYITIKRSCCPLNCFSLPAKSPICRSLNTLSSCSTSTSSSVATTSMSGSKQAAAWPG